MPVKKHRLNPEHLKVDSFATFTPDVDVGTGCVCDVAPCVCTRGEDCTQG
jgi:hypothetical protein